MLQSTDMYAGNATVKEYNKGLSLLKAGYTIFLVRLPHAFHFASMLAFASCAITAHQC